MSAACNAPRAAEAGSNTPWAVEAGGGARGGRGAGPYRRQCTSALYVPQGIFPYLLGPGYRKRGRIAGSLENNGQGACASCHARTGAFLRLSRLFPIRLAAPAPV